MQEAKKLNLTLSFSSYLHTSLLGLLLLLNNNDYY